MLEGGQPERPAIEVFSPSPGTAEREVLAGIEEEGVPCVLSRPTGRSDAGQLARDAARASSLDVGVGIDDTGRVCIWHELLSRPLEGLESTGPASKRSARLAGHNAARIVVGIPLRLNSPGGHHGAR
ncbi:MAG: glycerol dehydratase reactivase beta/small subunit family protein [Actinomycetota bacterium]|nr:glycerol dehydratase reactivase beta/small subunit family protein [Actinomycetota bacterium]